MPTKIRVLRAFNLSLPRPQPKEGQHENRLAIVRPFTVGDHILEDDDPALQHPYITEHFADGCIESPQQARKRESDEAKKLELQRVTDEKIQADADLKYKRLVGAISGDAAKADAQALQEELDTPVNKLNAKRAQGKK